MRPQVAVGKPFLHFRIAFSRLFDTIASRETETGEIDLIPKIRGFIQNERALNRLVDDAFVDFNVKRVRIVAPVAMPISLFMVLLFRFWTPIETPIDRLWASGIAWAHGSLLLAETVLFASSLWYLRHAKTKRCGKLIEFFGILIVLMAGTALTIIDQFVLTSITPFLIAVTISGAILRIRPYKAAILFLSSFAVLVGLMPLIQFDPNAIQSNIVNAVFAVFIGLMVNYFVYKSNRDAVLSRRELDQNQSELERLNRQLDYLASHDELTDIPNRRSFLKTFEETASETTALVLFDLDRFKSVNDTYGHPAGDLLLKAGADAIARKLRSTEAFARWGGEEFILLLRETSLKEATLRTESIRQILEDLTLTTGDHIIRTSASFGVTMVRAEEKPFDRAYHRADQALYQAKESGRNQTVAK
jgi:diguanylate cyclase (GGDEF)-like protein